MKVSSVNSQTFTIRHSDGVKTMTAECIMVNPMKNTMQWQFKHQNGMMKYFDMLEQGLEFYEKKGW